MHIEAHVVRPEPGPHAVRIELDKPAAQYAPGEAITGRVIVAPAVDDVCEALSIELQLHAHGWVSSVGVAAERRLYAGPWRAGVTASYPFRIDAPRTAGPYRGHLLNLELRLGAVMLLRREKRDAIGGLVGVNRHELVARAYPAAVQPIAVMPDARPLSVSIDPEKTRRALADRGLKVAIGCFMALAGLVTVGVAALMWLGIFEVAELFVPLLVGGIGLLVALPGSVFLLKNLGRWFAERKIGIPEFAVVTRDGVVDIAVRLPPDVSTAGVRATIAVVESATRSRGTGSETREHLIAEHHVELGRGAQPGLFATQLPVSALASLPPSIGLPAARIVWRLRVRVALPLWPDWEDEVPLDAYPGGERASTKARYVLTFD